MIHIAGVDTGAWVYGPHGCEFMTFAEMQRPPRPSNPLTWEGDDA